MNTNTLTGTVTRQGWRRGTPVAAVVAAIAMGLAAGCTSMGDALLEEHGMAPSGEWELVGDWLQVSADTGKTRRFSTFKKSPNQVSMTRIDNLGSFWIGGIRSSGTWQASGNTIYGKFDGETPDTITYRISGDTLVITSIRKDTASSGTISADTSRITFRKDNFDAFKRSATVYCTDPALNGKWTWKRTGNNTEYHLYFGVGGQLYDENNKYIDSSDYDALGWYAVDNNLFLLGLNCDKRTVDDRCTNYTIADSVKFEYTILTADTILLARIDTNERDMWARYSDVGEDASVPMKKRPSALSPRPIPSSPPSSLSILKKGKGK